MKQAHTSTTKGEDENGWKTARHRKVSTIQRVYTTEDEELNVKLLSVEKNIVILDDCRLNIILWYGNKSVTKE